MPRRSIALTVVLASLILAATAPLSARDTPAAETGTGGALLDALTRVPITAPTPEATVSYLDQEALVAARPGAAQPASLEQALSALDEGDPSAELWLAALMGAAGGDMALLGGLPQAVEWPARLGFDLLDVERHLAFGVPPSDGAVLIGRFDPAAIAAAHEARGYTASAAGSRTRLCGATGCDRGMDVDLANVDRGMPFGGDLGRSEPLSVAEGDLLVSADLATLEAMEAASDGEAASLAEDPAYRGLALAADRSITVTQATFLPGTMLWLGPDIYAVLKGSPEEASELLESTADVFERMPPPAAVAILDGVMGDEQVVTIGLAYEDESDASTAAQILPRRLATLPATSFGVPLSDLLEERGVTSVSGTVVPATDQAMPVARIEVRAPLRGSDAHGDASRPAPSSDLYRLFIDHVYRRDLLWLVPVLPEE